MKRPIAALAVLALITTGAAAQEGCDKGAKFRPWLADFKKEAVAEGIPANVVESALRGVEYNPKIVGLDRAQSVFSQSFLQFVKRMVADYRLTQGKAKIAKFRDSFERIEAEYGVPSAVLTGFWGLETDFGAVMGRDFAGALFDDDPAGEILRLEEAQAAGEIDADVAAAELEKIAAAPVFQMNVAEACGVLVELHEWILADERHVRDVEAQRQMLRDLEHAVDFVFVLNRAARVRVISNGDADVGAVAGHLFAQAGEFADLCVGGRTTARAAGSDEAVGGRTDLGAVVDAIFCNCELAFRRGKVDCSKQRGRFEIAEQRLHAAWRPHPFQRVSEQLYCMPACAANFVERRGEVACVAPVDRAVCEVKHGISV